MYLTFERYHPDMRVYLQKCVNANSDFDLDNNLFQSIPKACDCSLGFNLVVM